MNKKQVGWYVVFDEPGDDLEFPPEGFYIDDERKENWHKERGWLKNHLVPCYIDVD